MSFIITLLVLAFIGWVIYAVANQMSSRSPSKPLSPTPNRPNLPAPPDPGFVILNRTDIQGRQPDPWVPAPPAGFEPQPVGDLGYATINLNAVCMLTGTVVRDCTCDRHRNLKG